MNHLKKIESVCTLMLVFLFFFPGCSTIFQGTTQKIPVTSMPSGAKIFIDGNEMGTAPMILKLKKKTSHLLRIEKEGYDSVEIQVVRKSNYLLSALGNYLLGGTLGPVVGARILGDDMSFDYYLPMMLLGWGAGFLIDIITGANYRLIPNDVIITMSKEEKESVSGSLQVSVEDFENLKWIKIRCMEPEKKEESEKSE